MNCLLETVSSEIMCVVFVFVLATSTKVKEKRWLWGIVFKGIELMSSRISPDIESNLRMLFGER
jgi:hypothetical protein